MPLTPAQQVLRLGDALGQLIRERGVTINLVAKRLGVSAGQLSRVLRGRRPIHVELVFRIFEVLNVEPWAFFGVVYRVGADRARLERLWGEAMGEGTPGNTRQLFGQLARRSGLALPALAYTAKARRVLRAAIERRNLKQRQVARQAGMAGDALGEVLRGKVRLNFEHIFPVLQVLGWTPARFFLDLFAAEQADPIEAMSQSQLFDDIEDMVARQLGQGAAASPAAARKARSST